MGEIRGFKVFESDWSCSPRGNRKQYTCPGKFEEDITPIRCGTGMHFCKKAADCFNYYGFDPDKKVAEVIAYGDIAEEGDKSCTNKLEIVREISWQEVLELVNTGISCTGLCNTGDCNTGNRNTGCRNTGDWNTGDWNTGCRNTGRRNTGDWNTGDWNTGDWNDTNFSSGCLNTEEQKIQLFNKPSDWTYLDWLKSDARHLLNHMPQNVVEWVCDYEMTEEEKEAKPTYVTTGGYLKVLDKSESAQTWWDGLLSSEQNIIFSIPNFDPNIFSQITEIKL